MSRRLTRALLPATACAVLAAGLTAMPSAAATGAGAHPRAHAPSVSGVRLTHGNGRKGSTVAISGRYLSGATRVRFGLKRAPAISVHHGVVIATVPAHSPGLLHVTVSTPRGTSVKRPADLYPMPAPVSERWKVQTNIKIGKNQLADVSCATATHCVAVDQWLDAWTIDDGVWSDPVQLPGMIDRLSCPTIDFCVGSNPVELEVYKDGVWSRGPTMNATSWSGPHGISCASAHSCLATSPTTYRTYTDGVWSDEIPTPAIPGYTPVHFYDVACYDDTHCIAGGDGPHGPAYLFDGSEWTPMDAPGIPGVGQLTCASATLCAAESNNGVVAIWDGAAWSAPVASTDPSWRDNSLACTGSVCINEDAVGIDVYSNGAWTPTADSTYTLFGCASATSCLGEDGLGHTARFDGTAWQPTAQHLAAIGWASSFSCPSATFCAMTDRSGNAYTYDGAQWSDPVNLADTDFEHSAVSCPTAGYCLATFGDGTTARYDGSAWMPEPTALHAERSLTCFSVHVCLASGSHDMERFEDGEWTVVATGGPWTSMSCASVRFCAATTTGSVETWDGTRWRTAVADDQLWTANPHSVSCPTVEFCLVVDSGGRAITYRSGTWSVPEPTLTDEPLQVSCFSPTFCQVFGTEFEQTYDGQYWSAVDRFGDVGDLFDVQALACYAVNECLAATEWQIYSSHPA